MRSGFERHILRCALLTTFLAACVQTGRATTIVMPTDDDMVTGARAIVRAKVVKIETGLDQEHQLVYTYVTLKVREVLKGTITDRRIVLKQLGGEFGDSSTVIFGAPEFSPGERVILYLDTAPDGGLRVYQMFLGKFSIVTDTATGRDMAVRGTADAVSILPGWVGGQVTDRMEVNDYIKLVQELLAQNLSRSIDFANEHYNTPLLSVPPDYNPAQVSEGIHLQFRLFGPSRWFQPDSGQTVTYLVNPADAPAVPDLMGDMTAAMSAWSTVSGCSLRLVNGGTTSLLWNSPSVNVIAFNNNPADPNFSAGAGCAGVLAIGGFSSSSATRVVNGTVFTQIVRGYISFSPFMDCYLANSCRLREVATHELGHSIGLHHSWQSSFGGTPTALEQDATMFWSAHNDGRCAGLRTDDLNGIRFIYPGSVSAPTISTASPLTNAMVSGVYSRTFAATGGTAPYTWTLVSGSIPLGLTLTSAGVLSGTARTTAAGVYNFTIQVRDSANQTSQKAFGLTTQFVDVPSTHQFFDFINTIARRGVTAGCGNGNFCPSGTVVRSQMAVFMEKGMGVANPPLPGSQRFIDVPPTHFAYAFIDDCERRGIITVCGASRFCPDNLVTRADMAVFVERAIGVFSPPTPASQRFADVPPSHPAYAFIDDFARRGITAGCGSGNYCPSSSITRGEMSVFLVRAFGLQ